MSFIALIDYGLGNLGSVAKALEKAGAGVRLVSAPGQAEGAAGILLPGVGSFGDGMKNLESRGLASLIKEKTACGMPFLGICLGMQMLLESSEEAPGVPGLGIFKGTVKRFPEGSGEKIPHVGWNNIKHNGKNPFLKNVPDNAYFYFVHSFYASPANPENSAAETDYILPFSSALAGGNVFATQFHPEKSQKNGLAILENFVNICKNKK